MSAQSASRRFAVAIERMTFEGLKPETIEAAKARLLDAFGVSLRGVGTPVAAVAETAVSASSGPCALVGSERRLEASDAAFANAMLGHATLQEDQGGGGHPGTYVIPASLAIAEERGRSGRDLILAVVAGYETADRLARAMPDGFRARGFRSLGVVGPPASAVAVAKAMGLAAEAIATALSIGANLASGLYQGLEDGTMEAYVHAGFAAKHGVVAARLAEAGVVASPFTLEGIYGFFETYGGSAGAVDVLLEADGMNEGGVRRAASKVFPACGLNQAAMAFIRSLPVCGLESREIAAVTFRRPGARFGQKVAPGLLNDPPYESPLQAQMAAKFTAIAALLGRQVEDYAYFQQDFGEAEVERLCRRTEIELWEEPAFELEVSTATGERLMFRSKAPLGALQSEERPEGRFVRLARAVLGDEASAVVAAVERLESIADVRELTALLRPPARSIPAPAYVGRGPVAPSPCLWEGDAPDAIGDMSLTAPGGLDMFACNPDTTKGVSCVSSPRGDRQDAQG